MSEEIKSSQAVEEVPKIGLPIYLKGFVSFIVLSWVPFYGYMYLNARLSGIGYQSVFVAIDVWEAVYYFIISATDLFKYMYFGVEYAIAVLIVGMAIFLTMLLVTCRCIPREKIKIIVAEKNTKLSKFLRNNFVFSFVGAIFTAASLYVIPMAISIILGIVFLFSILGHVNGLKDGKDVLVGNKCIYAKPESSCVHLTINDLPKIGYVDYSNDKSTFFISNDGIYYLGAKGQVKQHKSFTLDLDMKVDSKEKFNANKWGEDVSSRVGMLKDFWNAKPEGVTGEYVLKQLGKSDVTFLYKDFPAYQLSKITDCKVAFPFDWISKEVVNVVFSGNCKGVI